MMRTLENLRVSITSDYVIKVSDMMNDFSEKEEALKFLRKYHFSEDSLLCRVCVTCGDDILSLDNIWYPVKLFGGERKGALISFPTTIDEEVVLLNCVFEGFDSEISYDPEKYVEEIKEMEEEWDSMYDFDSYKSSPIAGYEKINSNESLCSNELRRCTRRMF